MPSVGRHFYSELFAVTPAAVAHSWTISYCGLTTGQVSGANMLLDAIEETCHSIINTNPFAQLPYCRCGWLYGSLEAIVDGLGELGGRCGWLRGAWRPL